MANRTKSGGVSAEARKKFGSSKSSPNKTGSFPVFDTQSGLAALRLRGKAKSPKAVEDKVERFAQKTNNATLKAAVKRARAADKKK